MARRIAHGCRRDVGDHRHRRPLQRHRAQRLGHDFGGRLHQGAMEGRAHRQQHGPLGAARLGDLDRPLDRRLDGPTPPPGPAHCHWPPGRPRLAAASAATGDRRLEVEAEQRRHRPGADRASPAAWPGRGSAAAGRHRTEQKLPAAAKAEYSPSEWPATIAGGAGERRCRIRRSSTRSTAMRHRHQRRLGILGQDQFGSPALPT